MRRGQDTEARGRFVRGGGRYVADLVAGDSLAVGFVRSTVARGRLLKVDLGDVRDCDGIVAAFGAEDLVGHVRALPVRFGPGRLYDWQLLASDWVSFVGEPVAVVVGVDRTSVEEACELAAVDYEPLAAVTDVVVAEADISNLVRPETGSNVVFSASNEVGDVDAGFATASVVIERRFHLGRQSACPLENRGVLAYEEPLTGELIVSTSTQIPHVLRSTIAKVLGRREDSVRVVVPDVGGGFGVKAQVAAEECLVAWLAHHLGQRVAWIEDRWENLVASNHAHDEWVRLKVGFSASGVIVAVEADVTADVGAQSSYPLSVALEPSSTTVHLFACYKVPTARVVFRGVATNKCSSGAYRGVGAPIASFAGERVLDEGAAALGLSRIDIRRRNLISRHDVPYPHPIGGDMDSGDPLGVFDRLVADVRPDAPWLESLTRAGAAPPAVVGGALVGVGIAVFTEHTGPGSAVYRRRGVTEVPGYDTARIVMESDGTFVVFISSADAGQRHAAICARQVAEVLKVDVRLVSVVEGDTARCPPGTGTFASRFAVAQVSAALTAARRLNDRLIEAAASYLGCPSSDVQPAEGGYECGSGGAGVSLPELADWLYFPPGPLSGRILEVPFEELGYWDGGPALPCGALLSVVEVDPESFVARVRRISAVEECGRVLDREAVLGQLRGGIVMGIGDTLLEEHVYDSGGEIMTSSFMDYLLPTIAEAPEMELTLFEDDSILTTRSETASKGVGEAGTIGAVAAIGCALSDAIRGTGGYVDELPATPLRLFRASGHGLDPTEMVSQR